MSEGAASDAGAAPTPADKASAARSENFAKARAALAAKRAAAKTEPRPEKPETPAVSDSSLRDGARIFVRVSWAVTKLLARIAGRQLDALSAEEVSEGAEEALPLLRRFSLLASLLAFLGYPSFILRKVEEKLKPKAAQPEVSPVLPGQAAPKSNVHSISAGGP